MYGDLSLAPPWSVATGGAAIAACTLLLRAWAGERRDTLHRRLRAAFDAIPEAIAFYDADDRLVAWNSRYAELGRECGALLKVGAPFRKIVATRLAKGHFPEAAGREAEWLRERLQARRNSESNIERPLSDGRWLRIEDRRTADGGKINVLMDITHYKQREASFRMLFDSSPAPMWLAEPGSLRIVAANDAALRQFGHGREYLLQLSTFDLLHADEAALGDIGSDYDGERAWRFVRADGSEIVGKPYVRNTVREGRALLHTIMFDMTEQKRAEAALEHARDDAEKANRAKSEFLANMSHEIRTPLNGVLGVASALARTSLDPRQAEMVKLVQTSAASLERLLSDILDLSRVESGKLEIGRERFDLAEAVRAVGALCAMKAQEKGIALVVEIAPSCEGLVEGDPLRVKQIMTNLLSNAVKFTAVGGVQLTVERDGDGMGQGVRFRVVDTGVGFSAEAKARLFQRFEQADGSITRRFGGSGLGLTISRTLAEMMGGELAGDGEEGRGAVFTLVLPLPRATGSAARVGEDAGAPAEARAPAAPARPDASLRILLAEDHPVNRKVVELILASAGMSAQVVTNGALALEAAAEADYDVILMDMQMPEMDGLTAIREIRGLEAAGRCGRSWIVSLTANALEEHVEASRLAGADAHLAKPIQLEQLFAALKDVTPVIRRAA